MIKKHIELPMNFFVKLNIKKRQSNLLNKNFFQYK